MRTKTASKTLENCEAPSGCSRSTEDAPEGAGGLQLAAVPRRRDPRPAAPLSRPPFTPLPLLLSLAPASPLLRPPRAPSLPSAPRLPRRRCQAPGKGFSREVLGGFVGKGPPSPRGGKAGGVRPQPSGGSASAVGSAGAQPPARGVPGGAAAAGGAGARSSSGSFPLVPAGNPGALFWGDVADLPGFFGAGRGGRRVGRGGGL